MTEEDDKKEKEEAERKAAEEAEAKAKSESDENADAGDKGTKTTPLIDIANASAKRMEEANKETARLQAVQAERDQRIALGGQSQAGQPTAPELTDEEKASRARIKAVADSSGSSWGKKYE